MPKMRRVTIALSTSGRTEPGRLRLAHEGCHLVVERPAPRERGPLDIAVAADTQQQRDVGEPVEQHLHGRAQHEMQALRGGAALRLRLVEHSLEPVERLVEGHLEQLLLRREVVVHRRLRQAEPGRQVGDGCRVIALLVEERDRGGEHLGRGRNPDAHDAEARRCRLHGGRGVEWSPLSLALRSDARAGDRDRSADSAHAI